MVYIIVKKSKEHVNSALGNWDTPKGKYIKNEHHYNDEMKRQGFISYEQAQENKMRADEAKRKAKFTLSENTISILKSVKDSSDKNGNVKLSDRQVDAMKNAGLNTGESIKAKTSQVTGGQ